MRLFCLIDSKILNVPKATIFEVYSGISKENPTILTSFLKQAHAESLIELDMTFEKKWYGLKSRHVSPHDSDFQDQLENHLLSMSITVKDRKGLCEFLSKQKDLSIILVCEMGNQSGNAGEILQKSGFKNSFILSGGISEWRHNSLPLV